MGTDYQANSKKSKEQAEAKAEGRETASEKNLEQIPLQGDVIIKKRSLGRRFKDLLVQADLKGAAVYVVTDRMIPHIRNMIFDSGEAWLGRVIYRGKDPTKGNFPGAGYRVQYNNPINRQGYPPDPRYAPPVPLGPRSKGVGRSGQNDVILTSREDAQSVLTQLMDVIEQFECVSIFDLHEILGVPTNHVEQKWGWNNLTGTPIYPVQEGYLLALPPAEQI